MLLDGKDGLLILVRFLGLLQALSRKRLPYTISYVECQETFYVGCNKHIRRGNGLFTRPTSRDSSISHQ
jgi:hypothetical protein